MIVKSMTRLRINTGMVIFTGMAARLLISDMAIAPRANDQSSIEFPVNVIIITVMGVRIQP